MGQTATTITVTPEREASVREVFATIDARDPDGLAARFTPDAVQRLGNRPALQGREAIRAGNEAFLTSIAGLRHEITGIWESEGRVFVRLEVHYDRLDGQQVSIPVMTTWTETADDLIDTYDVFFDIGPVFDGGH